MHHSAHPRNASPPPSALARNEVPGGIADISGAPVTAPGASVGEASSLLPLLAVVVANVALAFGPWFVRLADTGPVAAAFWRMALAPHAAVSAPDGMRLRPKPNRLRIALDSFWNYQEIDTDRIPRAG